MRIQTRAPPMFSPIRGSIGMSSRKIVSAMKM